MKCIQTMILFCFIPFILQGCQHKEAELQAVDRQLLTKEVLVIIEC